MAGKSELGPTNCSFTLQFTIKNLFIYLFFFWHSGPINDLLCDPELHQWPAHVALSLVLPSLPDSEKTLNLYVCFTNLMVLVA